MKTLIVAIFVLIIGFPLKAQNTSTPIKVKTITNTIMLPVTIQEITVNKENNVAVIYIYKNYRIRKALSFTAADNKTKLA